MQENPQESPQRRIIPITKWNQYHPWPPPGGLRHLVFHADKNGFNQCILRAGRRVLIDEQKFFSWLESQNSAPSK
ncbi:MAG TPA: hypothetical protein DF383_02830 [Deltaproteobacteria bacterium]|nr:hypothetical protein [Deltaproteobacteria bacterium]